MGSHLYRDVEECPAVQRCCAWLAEIHLSAAQVGEGVSTQGPAFRTMTAIVTSSDCRRATHREEESLARLMHAHVCTQSHTHTPRQHTRFIYSAAFTSASLEEQKYLQHSDNQLSVNICQGCSWLSFVCTDSYLDMERPSVITFQDPFEMHSRLIRTWFWQEHKMQVRRVLMHLATTSLLSTTTQQTMKN